MVGSKKLLQMLSHLGLSITSDEVTRYKQSVLQSQEDNLPYSSPDSFTQWSADNVNHNIATLDDLGTFHGMGIISMFVPCEQLHNLPTGYVSDKSTQRLPRVTAAS